MTFRPWGNISWLLPRVAAANWHLITSASFEERCIAVAEWLAAYGHRPDSSIVLRISNPPSELWLEAAPHVQTNFEALRAVIVGEHHHVAAADLLASSLSSVCSAGTLNPNDAESVILDISTMPKRFFLFALKQLMNSPRVKNLIVAYSKAAEYPEVPMCENALPPAAFQGFGRIEETDEQPRLIVGVGYVPLSIEELLDTAKHSKVDFIFPFPPASPAFRRNWALLSMLMPTKDIPRNMEIHRINGMDAFEIYERSIAWGRDRALDFVPLGPKPHAIGMAMAYLRLEGRSELIYPQPQAYRFDYSRGIARDEAQQALICAYCLKQGGRWQF